MTSNLPKLFLYFLGILFIVNILQSYFTELIYDEAYYWYYAQDMAWGYFDHPPMVAFLIKISSLFFNGELGVRFTGCILSMGTTVLIWLSIDDPKKSMYIPHFFVLLFSMTLLNAYGFFMLPDTPLLFFTALFLLVYKRFLRNQTIMISLIMGLVMAALMYSKYHAVLVILCVLVSNLKLIFNKHAWLAVIVAIVSYTPHLVWLYKHNFVSIMYHLYERPNQAYDFNEFTLGYLLNIVAIFGLTFPFIYWALFKTKSTNKFIKALLFLVYGILLFFFISSFNRRVQTQWIVVVSIPAAILAYNYMIDHHSARKWIYRLGLVNILLLLYLRLGLIYVDISPIFYESHGNKYWANQIKSKIGDTPVIFENSYRRAPMYAFYSGSKTYSLNNTRYRQNQYSIDDSESQIQQKKILFVSNHKKEGEVAYEDLQGKRYYGSFIEPFESFRKLESFVDNKVNFTKDNPEVIIKLYNPYAINIEVGKVKFAVAYLNKYKQLNEIQPFGADAVLQNTLYIKANDTTYFSGRLPKAVKKTPAYFKIVLSENDLPWGLNGNNIKIE